MQFISLFGFWRRLGALCVAGLLVVGVAAAAFAAPPSQSASDGEAIFKTKCTACHTIGAGKLVGPDLDGVTTRRDKQWLTDWILAPDKMIAAKDPTAIQLLQEYNNVPMPNYGLTDAQVAALITYMESAQGTVVTKPTQALPQGDPAIGRALFTGTRRLQNGGPPCMGCHSVAGLGALGGGALGPDLTPAFNKYGDAGLANFLNTVPTITMNAVWTRQPLAANEQADLWAFLKQASVSERPADTIVQLTVLAVVGGAVLTVIAHLYWRKRLVAVRRPLVARSRIS
ncbi:MAG: cytochrome c [Chloroflexi bacterium]|nr:cytochrome c [Chloroflexota bacterium]